MKELIILLFTLYAQVNGAAIICSEGSPDLCIGFSAYLPGPFEQLQLKSRVGLANRNKTSVFWSFASERYDNITLDNSPFSIWGKGSDGLVLLANNTIARAFFANNTVQLPGGLCVTPMQCRPRGNSFCDPFSRIAANPNKLTKGSILRWRKCYGAENQRFVLDPPCAEGCSFLDQQQRSCKPECVTDYCLRTGNYTCVDIPPRNSTEAPTFRPTKMPTIAPSNNPPTGSPTKMPSSDSTIEPTTSPTEEPSAAPTLSPTDAEPTLPPTGAVTTRGSDAPTTHPSIATTQTPATPQVTPTCNEPKKDTEGPTSSPSQQIDPVIYTVLIVICVLLALPLIAILIYECVMTYKKRKNENERPALPKEPVPPLPAPSAPEEEEDEESPTMIPVDLSSPA